MIESVSRRAFSGSSGTYNVHALELAAARERHKLKGLEVTVRFLDDTERQFHVEKRAKGAALLDQVYQHLELVEKDYFGLQFADDAASEFMRWLDPSKGLKRQVGRAHGPLHFRVKFYVSDPSKLQEEYTRYQFCLQIRRDMLEGRLVLAPSTAILLASYTVQAEIGDYQAEEHGPDYLAGMQLVPNQSEDLEAKIAELHKLHKGQVPAEAEFNFLDHAKRVEMYGVELHKAKDITGKEIALGVTHIGLVVFHNNVRFNTFSWSKIMKISFKRKQFFIQLRREESENYDTLLGFNMETYRSSKVLWKACVEHHTFFRLYTPKVKRKFPLSLGSKFTYSGRTEFQTLSEVQQRVKLERKFVRSPSKQLIRQTLPQQIADEKSKAQTQRPRLYDNKVTSLGAKEPRKAWADEPQQSDDDGGFLERTLEGPFHPALSGRMLSYADEETSPTSNGLYDTPPYSASHSPTSQILENAPTAAADANDVDTIITITLHPDDEGKYGFNVKGGAPPDIPILISRVGPFTPADKCTPKLSINDQLIEINGVDVMHAHHKDVVELIQSARDVNDGKLVLVLRQMVEEEEDEVVGGGEGEGEEPPYHYVPVGDDLQQHSPGNALEQSMLLLADGLASGALLGHYEMLHRKCEGLTCDVSMDVKNIDKNRYRDILPYDNTRVILAEGPTGDYINANYVDMPINGSNLVNKYIATQGPLQSTNEDFWQMIIERGSNLIIMLTTLIEKGRTKCHKYWPNENESMLLQNVEIKCIKETIDGDTCIYRDFLVKNVKDGVEREVKHMQYVAWPDHGVPDSPEQFLRFTEMVRTMREGRDEAVVVHCSAGIGRTGVLVLMETALCLIEAEEPVYPLEIVKAMREQRAMMIQNASQYKFVCESVHSAYMKRNARKY